MSRLAEFRHLEKELSRQMGELEKIKNDEGLKREVEFENKLRHLMAECNFSLKHIIGAIDPQAVTRYFRKPVQGHALPSPGESLQEPANGELVETKGVNHTISKQWMAEHGHDDVDSWLQ